MRTLKATIVSDKMTNSAVARVDRAYTHALYKKQLIKSVRFTVDNPGNKYKVGDVVMIKEVKPMSRTKRFAIVSKVGEEILKEELNEDVVKEAAKIRETESMPEEVAESDETSEKEKVED